MRGKANKRRGQILIMTTLISIPLFGMLGLVTDLGYMHYVKMTAQSAAEAAAQSAMIDFHKTNGGASYTCGQTVVCASTETACPTNITSPSDPIQDGCMYAQAHGFTARGAVTY
jgi:Flp pilus assembly protein TadG